MAEIQTDSVDRKEFKQKVWMTVGIVALVVVVLWLLKAVFNVLLLILAGVLIALYFRGLSKLIHRKTGMSEKVSLPLSIIGSILLLLGFFWFAGASIQQQATQLSETLPSTVQKAKEELGKSALGKRVLQGLQAQQKNSQGSNMLQGFFRSTFGVLGDIYVVLFLGIFFTAGPRSYLNGLVRLAPARARPRTSEVITRVGHTLTKWLKGQLFAMLLVAVLTLVGLLIMGVPMALVLALIAGVLNFIPNFGPLIAMIPAVGVGLLQGPTTALMVAGLYILVQVLESNVITPQIQKRLIEIPPALIIISQLFMGVLTGGWGLVLATPLIAIVMVVVQELWVKSQDKEEKHR
jgi:predicted PurR-regulated permease PerM